MDQPISQLPVATTLTGLELTPVVQNGITKQAQVSQLANAVSPGKLISSATIDGTNILFLYSDGTSSTAGPVVATVAIGSTTTLSAGSSATVTNSGSSANGIFNFGIPRGATGATGAGVAAGGTTGQILSKASNTDYDTAWKAFTGTGDVVLSDSPSLTGTLFALNVAANGSLSVFGTAIMISTVTLGGTNSTSTLTFGQPTTASQTINIANAVLASGNTQNINIGASAAAGAATNVTVGSTLGTSTTILNGTVRPSALTASRAVFTDTNKNLVSTATTGSGNVVLSTSPTLVTPALGTPTSLTLTSATGLPLTTGVTGTLPVANGGTGVTTSTGSGNNVLSNSPTLVTPVLGTPTSVTLTNATGLPLTTGVSGTLPVANGGTGLSTLTAGSITYGAGTSAYVPLAIGTAGQVLTVNSGATAPQWSSIPAQVYPGVGIPNSTGSAWGTSYGVTGTGSVVLSDSPTLTGNVSANVNLRSDTLANLLPLAGGTSEIGYATDVDALVRFNGTAGQAQVLGAYGNGGTLNFTINASNVAALTNPASGVYIDCNNVSYLIINIDSSIVLTGNTYTSLNIKLPNSASIPTFKVFIPYTSNANSFWNANSFTINLAFQSSDICNFYDPISADLPTSSTGPWNPLFKLGNFISTEITFVANMITAGVGSGWKRLPVSGEGAYNFSNASGASIGTAITGTGSTQTLTSGTVATSSTLVLTSGLWLITGYVTFNVTSTVIASEIMAGINNAATTSVPTNSSIQSMVRTTENLPTAGNITMAFAPVVYGVSVGTVNRYGTARATFTAGTITANVTQRAIRIG